MTMKQFEEDRLKRAKERLDQLKGFYIHLTVYLVINSIILMNFVIRSLNSDYDFWTFPSFITAFFWGIGLFFHAANVFNILPFYGKNWERRQIEKFMMEDQQESQKYK